MLSTNLLDDGTVESGWTDSFHSQQSESRLPPVFTSQAVPLAWRRGQISLSGLE